MLEFDLKDWACTEACKILLTLLTLSCGLNIGFSKTPG